MTRQICFAVALVLAFCSASHAKRDVQYVHIGKDTVHSCNFGTNEISIYIKTCTLDRDKSCTFPTDLPPEITNVTMIRSLSIQINGMEVLVPYSSFTSLEDPGYFYIENENNKYAIVIRGGDGAYTYIAKLFFDAKRVFLKTVYSALSPNEAVEETTYRLVEVDDDDK